MPKSLLIATHNTGKQVEIKNILQSLPVALITPIDAGLELDVQEIGSTYQENASLKALAFAEASGCISLADDSGLEVQVLDGAPGIYSARFSPKPGATDADRRNYLLEKLRDYARPWKARFYCQVAIATPQGAIYFSEGGCQGEIIPEERGTGGFGYDPIFFLPELQCTMAELNPHQKNEYSHRGQAVRASIPILEILLLNPKSN